MEKDYSYIYIIGYGANFDITYVADTKEKAQAKMKKYIEEIETNNEWFSSKEEKQNFLKTLQIREYCINDDYCTYGIIHF